MTDYIIKNACVYDPANKVAGEIRDIYVVDGKIAEEPSANAEVIDAAGCLLSYLYFVSV